MQVDSVLQFRKLEPKKKYRYTYLRFEKGQHNDLINKHAAVYEIDGNFLIIPFKESVCTQESLNEKISKVRQSLERQIEVQTENKHAETGAIEIERRTIENRAEQKEWGRIRGPSSCP